MGCGFLRNHPWLICLSARCDVAGMPVIWLARSCVVHLRDNALTKLLEELEVTRETSSKTQKPQGVMKSTEKAVKAGESLRFEDEDNVEHAFEHGICVQKHLRWNFYTIFKKQLSSISWDKRFISIISNAFHRDKVRNVHFNQQETKKLKSFTQSTSFHAPATQKKSKKWRAANCTLDDMHSDSALPSVVYLSFYSAQLTHVSKATTFCKKKEEKEEDDTCPRERLRRQEQHPGVCKREMRMARKMKVLSGHFFWLKWFFLKLFIRLGWFETVFFNGCDFFFKWTFR